MDLADRSIFHHMPTKNGGRWNIAAEYAEVVAQPRQTAIFWKPADNNELGTRNRINEYLQYDEERIHPITKQKGAAQLFFVRSNATYPQGVEHIIRETRSQRRVKIGTDLGKPVFSDERDPSITDHGYDVLRYMIAGRPALAAERAPVSHGTFARAAAGQAPVADRTLSRPTSRRGTECGAGVSFFHILVVVSLATII